jgi:hypothetical protein
VRYFIAGILFCTLFLTSCSTGNICVETPQTYLNAGFYQVVNGEEKDTSLQDFTAFGIPGTDSLLYDEADNISAISLPLSPLDDQCSFVFSFSIPDTVYRPDTVQVVDRIDIIYELDTVYLQDTFNIIFEPVDDTVWMDSIFLAPELISYKLYDTVSISYQRKLTLVSEECGFTYYFNIRDISATSNVIKANSVTNSAITLSEDENVKLRF